MKTPAQYQHDVSEIPTKAKDREAINQALEQLVQIENSLNLDLHALKAQYQGRAAALKMQAGRHAGKGHGEEEQRLEDERQGKLAPYEEVKAQIEELRQKLEKASGKLDKAVPG